MTKDNIIIVGGYGHVGKILCTELSEMFPGKVFPAGRSMERATEFSKQSDGKAGLSGYCLAKCGIGPGTDESVFRGIVCGNGWGSR